MFGREKVEEIWICSWPCFGKHSAGRIMNRGKVMASFMSAFTPSAAAEVLGCWGIQEIINHKLYLGFCR